METNKKQRRPDGVEAIKYFVKIIKIHILISVLELDINLWYLITMPLRNVEINTGNGN